MKVTDEILECINFAGAISKRRIVCSANKIKLFKDGEFVSDSVLLGIRHWDEQMRNQADILELAGYTYECNMDDQGFIDQFGVWCNREDAMKIAISQNQVTHNIGSYDELYSEHLY